MSKYALLADHKLCFDCRACEVACKQMNKLGDGIRWIHVVTVGPRMVGDEMVTDYLPTMCRHCAEPPCIDACPTEAITKRADGVVLIDDELCNGCMACITACPYAALQYDEARSVVDKCNMCLDRIERGMQPACVQACPAKTIYFGETNDIIRQIQKQRAATLL